MPSRTSARSPLRKRPKKTKCFSHPQRDAISHLAGVFMCQECVERHIKVGLRPTNLAQARQRQVSMKPRHAAALALLGWYSHRTKNRRNHQSMGRLGKSVRFGSELQKERERLRAEAPRRLQIRS